MAQPVSASGLAALVLSGSAFALQPMSEADMAGVDARDGLMLTVDGSPSVGMIVLDVDASTAAQRNQLQMHNVSWAHTGSATQALVNTLDAGATASGEPYLHLRSDLDRGRLLMNSLTLGSDPGRSFGQWALNGKFDLELLNRGLFHNDPGNDSARLYLALTDASLFYRQNWYYHSNITLDDLDFVWDLPRGSVGMAGNELRVAGDVDFRLNFDLLYKFHPDQDLNTITANDRPMVNFGWEGRLYDADVRIRAGGVWDGSEVGGAIDQTARTGGINIGLGWNYKKNQGDAVTPNDLRWQVGRAGGNNMRLEFGDWRNLQNGAGVRVPLGFDFPSITFDVVPGGVAGPGGLCWGADVHGSGCAGAGGKLLELAVGDISGYSAAVNRTDGGAGLFLIRDGNLLAYSNQVTASASGPDGVMGTADDVMAPETYNWGLIYTLANINSNIAFYPGGSESDVGGGSRSQGVMADILITSQTFSAGTQGYNWENGTHFMIADTCSAVGPGCPDGEVNMGIGYLGANFLLAADNTRIWLKNTWAGTAFPNNWQGGIDLTSPRARLQLSGLLGGVQLPTGLDRVDIASVDLNLEGLLNFRLSPPPDGENFLAYSGAVRLYNMSDTANSVLTSGSGSYWSIAEPGRPDIDLRFANMSGDFAIDQGRLEVIARDELGPGSDPMLVLEQRLLVGMSAASRIADSVSGMTLPGGWAAGQPLRSEVYLGDKRMGQMVIPAANLGGSIALMPK